MRHGEDWDVVLHLYTSRNTILVNRTAILLVTVGTKNLRSDTVWCVSRSCSLPAGGRAFPIPIRSTALWCISPHTPNCLRRWCGTVGRSVVHPGPCACRGHRTSRRCTRCILHSVSADPRTRPRWPMAGHCIRRENHSSWGGSSRPARVSASWSTVRHLSYDSCIETDNSVYLVRRGLGSRSRDLCTDNPSHHQAGMCQLC